MSSFISYQIYYFTCCIYYTDSIVKCIFIHTKFGFAVLFYLLSLEAVVLKVNDPTGEPADHSFLNLLYYSGVTILSVGYGDLVPVGSARFFSLIEAAIGLLLPAAYFVKVLNSQDKEKGWVQQEFSSKNRI
ncbi:potassium channel family protein [Alteribacillus sp. JSM 102045]|uniref:potassium channel family protein n=1 Tax=Alteribacillus sp. JSM 102045 TaxID=1562101 RepID=UPI0035BEDD49